jgi:Asp-tRNA(Asn)/Glu-tRNA(Gln) amidotransferase A subunit family amidase
VDSMVLGDQKACDLHEITRMSLSRYRKRFKDDPILAKAVFKIRETNVKPLEPSIKDAITTYIKWLKDAPAQLEVVNAENIAAVTNAYRTMAEIELANKMIDAKMTQIACGAKTGPKPKEIAASEATIDV